MTDINLNFIAIKAKVTKEQHDRTIKLINTAFNISVVLSVVSIIVGSIADNGTLISHLSIIVLFVSLFGMLFGVTINTDSYSTHRTKTLESLAVLATYKESIKEDKELTEAIRKLIE